MLTIEEARKRLPPELSQATDKEIQHMLDRMYFVCNFAWNRQINHPGEKFADRKIIKPSKL